MPNPPKFHKEAVADILNDIDSVYREMNTNLIATIQQAALRRIRISHKISALDKAVKSVKKDVMELENGETNIDFDVFCGKAQLVHAQMESIKEKISKLLIPDLRMVN